MTARRATKTTIVTPRIPDRDPTGGIGIFVGNFVRLLRDAGDDVTVILTEPLRPESADGGIGDDQQQRQWEEAGVKFINLLADPLPMPHAWFPPGLQIAEMVDRAIPPETDVVYFADWKANGFSTVKRRRFDADAAAPTVVTVLHGGTAWQHEGEQRWVTSYEDIRDEFNERYVVEHSDFVVAPSDHARQWATQKGWQLPADGRSVTLTYPFMPPATPAEARKATGETFERIVFFGRLEKRAGIDLFVEALLALEGEDCLKSVREIVLLGEEGEHRYGDAKGIASVLRSALAVQVRTLTDLDAEEAQRYLARNVAGTLVVVPSRAETLGFAIIAASLIEGLNVICSNAGGIPEIFGADGESQLFDPYLRGVARAIERWLRQGPQPADELGRYDWRAANARWLAFHRNACAYAAEQRAAAPPRRGAAADVLADPRVDVCITYYNLGDYLPTLLESLDRQTMPSFNLFVINDGSTDEASVAIFQQMTDKYAHKGWRFVTTKNQGVSAARNFAASLGEAEYICFMDGDNIALPNMIERFLTSIEHSHDDLLTCYIYRFPGDTSPYVGGIPLVSNGYIIPIGNAPEAIIVGNPFGDLNGILRRSAFEAVGGFTLDYDKYINCEDLELFVRISLAGFKIDVIPAFLFLYRERSESRLRTTEVYRNERRYLRVYEERLREVGLEGLISLAMGLRETITINGDFDRDQFRQLLDWSEHLKRENDQKDATIREALAYTEKLEATIATKEREHVIIEEYAHTLEEALETMRQNGSAALASDTPLPWKLKI